MDFRRAGEEPIYVFNVGDEYYFKYYFEDTEIFKALSRYYNSEEYRFEFQPDERDNVMEVLSENGYSLVNAADIDEFAVAKRKYTDHPDVLFKKSVMQKSKRDYNLFLMQDETAVENAVRTGAIPVTELDVSFTD